MEIKFSKNAIKFLNKLTSKNKEKIRTKILFLLNFIETQGSIPIRELDIKKLKGNWQGFSECESARLGLFLRLVRIRKNYQSMKLTLEVISISDNFCFRYRSPLPEQHCKSDRTIKTDTSEI